MSHSRGRRKAESERWKHHQGTPTRLTCFPVEETRSSPVRALNPQLDILEKAFQDCADPSKAFTTRVLQELAAQTGLKVKWIRAWWTRTRLRFRSHPELRFNSTLHGPSPLSNPSITAESLPDLKPVDESQWPTHFLVSRIESKPTPPPPQPRPVRSNAMRSPLAPTSANPKTLSNYPPKATLSYQNVYPTHSMRHAPYRLPSNSPHDRSLPRTSTMRPAITPSHPQMPQSRPSQSHIQRQRMQHNQYPPQNLAFHQHQHFHLSSNCVSNMNDQNQTQPDLFQQIMRNIEAESENMVPQDLELSSNGILAADNNNDSSEDLFMQLMREAVAENENKYQAILEDATNRQFWGVGNNATTVDEFLCF